MSVDDAVAFFEADEPRHKSYPIVDGVGRLVGLVARADALRWRTEGGHGASTLYDMASDENVAFAHPSDLLGRVADIMVTHEVGRVPIVEEGSHRLVGLVARKDILHMRRLRMAQESERTPVLGTRGRAVRAS